MKKYDVLIFDWDGTIANSRADIVGSLKVAIAECNLEAPDDNALGNLIGLGLAQAFIQLFPNESAAKIKQLSDAFRAAMYKPGGHTTQLFPLVRETLDILKEDYVLTVATGKSRRGLDEELRSTDLESYFPITRTADETHSKPNPTMLFEIITDLDTSAGCCLMIGDTDYDLNMARNANMDCVALTCGVHDEQRLKAAAPNAMLKSVADLPEWLKGNAVA